MKPKYSAADIANYFLLKAQEDDQELLSNMKLQKLVYYAQGIHLAIYGTPVFKDKIVAWQYGPVVRTLYHKYKSFGAGCIPADDGFDVSIIDDDTLTFLNEIYDFFGQYSAIRLMEIAHSDQCWQDAGINNEITHASMQKCLKKYLKK